MSSPQGRFAEEASRLNGRKLRDVEAYGKHLFYDFGSGELVHVHLGLFGRYFLHAGWPPPAPRESARLRIARPAKGPTVDLVGATECRLIDPATMDSVLSRLGPDPLRPGADPEEGWAKLQRRKTGIGLALMDQSVLAGVGNVYRAEVLAVHRLHPEQPANTISREEWDSMWRTLVGWLTVAVEEQVIITLDDEVLEKPRTELRKGEAQHVYKQDRCRRCGTEIRRWDLKGRWAYACEACQPLRTGGSDP